MSAGRLLFLSMGTLAMSTEFGMRQDEMGCDGPAYVHRAHGHVVAAAHVAVVHVAVVHGCVVGVVHYFDSSFACQVEVWNDEVGE
jgi:hypothetical protein